MNIIAQTTGGYASSLSGKIESHNKTLANTIRPLLMNSYECNFLILIPQCSNKKIAFIRVH